MAAVSLLGACGSDAADGRVGSAAEDSVPAGSAPAATQPVETPPVETEPVSVPVTESSTSESALDAAIDASDLPPMEVVASLGYPRDLLDRGRVNIKVARDDATEFVIVDKQLVIDDFTPAPVEERRTVLPPDGRIVAIQTLFGEVADCDSPGPVTAALVVTFLYGDSPDLRTTSIPLTDATTLDNIRLQKCTVLQLLAENDIELRDPVVDGETMTVDLVFARRTGDSRLGFDSIKGTVLFGAATDTEPGDPARVLEPDETEAIIPLLMDVNRCDSHAVAETTRKFGIDLYVAVDGLESQRIEVPIEPVVADLEAMLDTCKARTGQ